MIKYLINILLIFTAVVTSSCENDEPTDGVTRKMPLVVEGWIEDEGLPVVIVTRATDFNSGNAPLDNLVERWCRVTVSDGIQSEVLPMRINSNYKPGVIYSANRLRGKIGRTYTLMVETDTDTVTAITTIPPVARLDSLQTVRIEGSDTLFGIRAFAGIDVSKSCYYKFFTQVRGRESRYYSSFLGTFTADEYDSNQGWNVAKGIHDTFGEHYTPHYLSGDTVNVKLCTMDSTVYEFWQAYENTVSLSGNMFFTVTEGCPSCISGGLGYWAGYGTSIARIIISPPEEH